MAHYALSVDGADAGVGVSTITTDLTGILVVDKPSGWTSHDVVARVRRLVGQRRVGHAGTLDPLATGVLPVLLGRATRLMDLVQSESKTYVATVTLGAATDTDDAEGAVVRTAAVPRFDTPTLKSALTRFEGDILQTPPPYSALKVNGQRAYKLARSGAAVTLEPRQITIDSLSLLAFTENALTIEVTCSKGTYIRALARDIAQALGTVGHMSSLRRTRVGPFSLDDAVSLEDPTLIDHVRSAGAADSTAPQHTASEEEAHKLVNGQPIPTTLRAERVWVYDPNGQLLCLAAANGTILRPLFRL